MDSLTDMRPKRKIKLTIAYDGTEYHGWQIQPGLRTVQGALCEAATSLLRYPTQVQGASRTDAGVHARGQAGLIETGHPIAAEHLALGLNDFLPQDIVVLDAREVEPEFNLTRDVTRKAYRYTIYTGRFRSVRRIRFCWHLPARLDVEAMHEAARHLLGMHDFRSFAGALEEGRGTVRTLFRCDVARGIDDDPDAVAIDVEGDGFLHHMVRIIAGTLIDIGRGHWSPEDVPQILAACNRKAAGHLAPPAGLSLEWIRYRQDESADKPSCDGAE